MDHSLGAFITLCFLLTITPGADTALILRSAIGGHRKGFILTTTGICTGLLAHATLSALGLSAILQKSAELYSTVKWIGAAYLIYLGARGLFDAFFAKTAKNSGEAPSLPRDASGFANFRTGLLTNILNPKVAVFYLTFLPQFVDIGGNVFLQSIGLASIHVAFSFAWLFLIGFFVSSFKTVLTKDSVKRKIEAVTGLALLGFGLRLAISKD